MIDKYWLLRALEAQRLVIRARLVEHASGRKGATIQLLTGHNDDDGLVVGRVIYAYSSISRLGVITASFPESADAAGLDRWVRPEISLLLGSPSWQEEVEQCGEYVHLDGCSVKLDLGSDLTLALHLARAYGLVAKLGESQKTEPRRTLLFSMAHRMDGLLHEIETRMT